MQCYVTCSNVCVATIGRVLWPQWAAVLGGKEMSVSSEDETTSDVRRDAWSSACLARVAQHIWLKNKRRADVPALNGSGKIGEKTNVLRAPWQHILHYYAAA